MPDPWQYAMAIAAAGLVSMLGSAVLESCQTCPLRLRDGLFVLLICAGMVAGCLILEFRWSWPASSALDRFLTIVLPCMMITELVVALIRPQEIAPRTSPETTQQTKPVGRRRRMVVHLLRVLLCAVCGRILLHDSVYLRGSNSAAMESWSNTQASAILIAGGLLMAIIREAVARQSLLESPVSIGYGLVFAIFTAGLTTMLGGYIRGGAAAFPLGGALLGTVIALVMRPGQAVTQSHHFDVVITSGVTVLFSLLWIAHFFGNVGATEAVMIFLSPLAGWLTELPGFSRIDRKPRIAMRLMLMTIPLLLVLWIAWQRFATRMSPLIAELPAAKQILTVNHANTVIHQTHLDDSRIWSDRAVIMQEGGRLVPRKARRVLRTRCAAAMVTGSGHSAEPVLTPDASHRSITMVTT